MLFKTICEFLPTSLAVAASPGPSMVLILSIAASRGSWLAGIAIAANAIGLTLHVFFSFLCVFSIIHISNHTLFVIRLVGGAYLGYVGLTMIAQRMPRTHLSSSCDRGVFVQALLTNVSNPKVFMLMMALLPQYTTWDGGNPASTYVALGAFHIAIASLVFGVLVCVLECAKRRGVGMVLPQWCRVGFRLLCICFAGPS